MTQRRLLFLQALISALILGAALVSQYGFGLYPCELCLAQRVPYALIVLIGAFGAWFCRNLRWQRWLIFLNAALFFADAGIAGYHAGVEAGVFPGPDACSSKGGGEESLEELRQMILNAPRVSCDQAQFYFLGLTMAAWNALAALGLAVLSVYFMRKQKK